MKNKDILLNLRQQLDVVIESESAESRENLAQSLVAVLAYLKTEYPAQNPGEDPEYFLRLFEDSWLNGSLPPLEFSTGPERQARLFRLLSDIVEVQKFALSLARGDLSKSLKTRGMMASSLKSLHANLRHLTWQTRMVAAGDFTQKVDFMGEFSDSFNSMVQSLSEARDQLKHNEEELARANLRLSKEIAEVRSGREKLTEAYKELEAFSYSVSHDLRAPLRSIEGFTSHILEDCFDKLDERSKDLFRRVLGATRRMSMIIDGLLGLSRISRTELKKGTVDLSAAAREIIGELKKAQPEREIECIVAEGLIAEGDERLLYSVLQNLIGNAWKFTEKREKARLEFGASGHDGKTAYFVRDNGAGFDMAYADKLFNPFQRLHSASDFSGTGIGLATVQRIIRRHGGRVWAEGEVGKGATFYFSLK